MNEEYRNMKLLDFLIFHRQLLGMILNDTKKLGATKTEKKEAKKGSENSKNKFYYFLIHGYYKILIRSYFISYTFLTNLKITYKIKRCGKDFNYGKIMSYRPNVSFYL